MTPLTSAPILIGANGKTRVDSNYQQFFDQYTTANIPLLQSKTAGDDLDLPGWDQHV